MLISIIVVTWNSASYLPRCLESLATQSFKDFEIVIVDNGSVDGSLTGLEEKYPRLDIKIERLETNQGYAPANNIGSKLGRGEWLAFLNADAFPSPDWLEQLVSASHQNPEYVCFSSRQIMADNIKMLDGEGDTYHISGMAWRRNYNIPVYDTSEPVEVFSACGAAMMVRKQDFLDMGGFDETYFAYFEDVDLGFRLRLSGKKTLFLPESIVYHVGSGSTGRRSDFLVYYQYRNMIWTFIKNMPSPLILLFSPLHIAALVFFWGATARRGQGRIFMNSVFDALRDLPRVLGQRRKIQSQRKASNKDVISAMSTGVREPYQEFMKRNRVAYKDPS
jgi:GT2 family glycosyltransferase